MSQDEFFLDDDVIITFDDGVIEEIIPEVSIIEQRFKEDSILRLNKDQINAALVNLISSKYKNSTRLKQKVRNYLNLFFHLDTSSIKFKQLRPIISVNKHTYFDSDEAYSQNKEYEQAHFEKSEKLGAFLNKFYSISVQSKETYIKSANKLYALYAPFSNREDIPSVPYQPEEDIDAFTQCIFEDEFDCSASPQQTFRLITKVVNGGKNIVYNGDQVNIIGFYNAVSSTAPTLTFDIEQYTLQLQKMTEGERVIVAFNHPVFDKNRKKILKTVKGTVTQHDTQTGVIKIKLKDSVFMGDKLLDEVSYSLATLRQPFYIYIEALYQGDTPMFHKPMLASHNIIFRFPKAVHAQAIDFVTPSSVAELIWLYEHDFAHIYNIHDLAKRILIPNGINLDDLTVDVYHLLAYIFESDKPTQTQSSEITKSPKKLPYRNTTPALDFKKHAEYLVNYSKDYTSYDSFIDDALNRFRYLKSQQDAGAYYFLNLIKSDLKSKYKRHIDTLSVLNKDMKIIHKSLDGLEMPSTTTNASSAPCDAQFAKEYKKLDKLVEDNGKPIYFDKSHDTTMYTLKQTYTQNSSQGLRLHILNELLTIPKYKEMSKTDLEFEVATILDGKRRVRIGDICVLHGPYGDTVYTRQMVKDTEMWVKKFKTPFKVCTDNPLVKFNDLVKLETCIKQTFDDICYTNSHARVLYKYRTLSAIKNELSSILSLLDGYEEIVKIVDSDIEYQKSVAQILPHQHGVKRKFEYIEHIDYNDFYGEERDESQIAYEIDFNDQSNFTLINSQSKRPVTEELPNSDILRMLLNFIQIPLDTKEGVYILDNVNTKYPKTHVTVQVQQYENALLSKVNKELKSSEKYMKMFDTAVKQKVLKFEEDLLKKYYFNVFRHTIAYIIIIMFIRYPAYTMKNVLQSCVRVLSYMGYPMDEKDGERSLTAYFACLLVNISVPEDIRFQAFFDQEVDEIQKTLRTTIDEILDSNYELRTQLNLSKAIFPTLTKSSSSVAHKSEPYTTLVAFRPQFKFGNLDKMSKHNKMVIRYMRSIQNSIAASKIAKFSSLNIPSMVNTCCVETLTKDLNFFNFLDQTSSEFKTAQTSLAQLHKPKFIDENLHPPLKTKHTVDIFSKLLIKHSVGHIQPLTMEQPPHKDTHNFSNFVSMNPHIIREGDVLMQLDKYYASDNWWFDVFYPKLGDDFNSLTDTMMRLVDNNTVDKDGIELIKEAIVNVSGQYNVSSVRQVLYSFLSSRIKQLIGKIVNKQKLDETQLSEESIRSNPLYGLIATLSNTNKYDKLLANVRDIITNVKGVESMFIKSDKEDVIVKNISILTSVMIAIFRSILLSTTSGNTFSDVVYSSTVEQKDQLHISCDIINFSFKALATQLQNTLVDVTFLNSEVERLREQRKQELMAAYKVDEEERQLQMVLKKIGVKNWTDILSNEDDDIKSDEQRSAENPPMPVKKDEYEIEKDYVYATYKGENDDGDQYNDQDDEDQFVSVESYDN